MTRLLGIYREKEYSPGRHQSNDARLLEQVADELRRLGPRVDLLTIDQAVAARKRPAFVFSMCQGRTALDVLAGWERKGTRIVNSPGAALNTYRDRLPDLMARAGVPYPSTRLVSTVPGPHPLSVDGGVWLKRGDVHASVSADVQWIDTEERLATGLADFASRGIAAAAVQAHRPGDEIKFYGVSGGRFFHWFHSGRSRSIAFDAAALERFASDAAAAAGLDIYGGDVIVTSGGELTLIDLNDWPSFAPCRDAAAEAIADFLVRRLNALWDPALVAGANQGTV